MSRLISKSISPFKGGLSAKAVCILSAAFAAVLLAGCTPRVATSFWRIGTPADSLKPGYTVIHAEGKTRHCYPVTEWTDGPETDTYHQLHHHGVAVESELMAYRIYFDKKQTIDPYCKRKPQLELGESYWYPNDSLLAAHYGDDILRVSGTVGVGSVKYWNGKLHHIEEVGERQQLIVRKGRNKATIAVRDIDWTVPDGKQDRPETRHVVNLYVRYTMRAGHRDMRCDVFCSDTIQGLCTGVQFIPKNLKDPKDLKDFISIRLPNGVLLASWGTDWPVNDTVKYAKETVGLGVFIPNAYAGELVHDKHNNLCLLKMNKIKGNKTKGLYGEYGIPATCHFYLTTVGATKEDHPVATTAGEWYAYLRKWAKGLK
jgi:hypothetical protein